MKLLDYLGKFKKKANPNTLFILLISFLLLACNETEDKVDLSGLKKNEDILVHIDTDYGRMTAILYDKTPLHKQNFLKLSNEGFYNGLLFHRIISGFMVQGGDPESKNATKDAVLGRGDTGENIPVELDTTIFHKKGVLSAARKNDQVNPEKKSNGSQFFIVQGTKFSEEDLNDILIDYRKLYVYFDSLMKSDGFNEMKSRFASLQTEGDREDIRNFIVESKDTIEHVFNIEIDKYMPEQQKEVYKTKGGYPSLDGAYSAFGEVIKGLEVIDKIASVKTGKGDRPVEDIEMQISLERLEKRDIENEYGYKYE